MRNNIITIILAIFTITMTGAAKRPSATTVQSGRIVADAVVNEDTLHYVTFEAFDAPPVMVCGAANQLAIVSCQALDNSSGAIWVRSLTFTGEMPVNWIAADTPLAGGK